MSDVLIQMPSKRRNKALPMQDTSCALWNHIIVTRYETDEMWTTNFTVFFEIPEQSDILKTSSRIPCFVVYSLSEDHEFVKSKRVEEGGQDHWLIDARMAWKKGRTRHMIFKGLVIWFPGSNVGVFDVFRLHMYTCTRICSIRGVAVLKVLVSKQLPSVEVREQHSQPSTICVGWQIFSTLTCPE